MRYEDMPIEARTAAAGAASRFLIDNSYASLEEACIDRDVTLPMLWAKIQADSDLPPCDVPDFGLTASG